MQVGNYVLRDLDVDGIAATFSTQTSAGAVALKERLSAPVVDPVEIDKRQAQIRDLRGKLKDPKVKADVLAALGDLKECEADALSIATAHDDQRHSEYYNQILWSPTSVAARLNSMGWFNEGMVFFRTVFLPGISVILPLLVLVAPFVLYYVVLKQPLDFSQYLTILQDSFKKAVPSVLGKPRFAGRGGAIEVGEKFMHVAASLVVFGASIWNQISSALSMRTVVADMRRRATSLQRFTEATRRLASILGLGVEAPTWSTGALGTFGDAWNQTDRVHALLKTAGNIDMLVAVARLKRTAFPRRGDHVAIEDIYHPGTGSKRVYNSIDLRDRNHVLLTGPNRGGKSTMLKSLGMAVLMAQTVGVVFARKAVLPVFGSLITALSPADVIGKMSLFEAEIEFAKDVKGRLAAQDDAGPMFLMMDEIFHGTNAHDGVEASQIFLDDLYTVGADRVVSVVSTHYMNLPERYGSEKALNLCMEASEDPADPDRLVYTYKLCAGINRFSSVREILRERGLLRGKVEEKQSAPASKE
jgi:hypothetical protein